MMSVQNVDFLEPQLAEQPVVIQLTLEQLEMLISAIKTELKEPPRKAWTTKEVAKILGTSEYSVRELVKKGRIKYIPIGNTWHITNYQLNKFLGIKE